MNPLNPKKLHLTKWTAVTPVAKQKPRRSFRGKIYETTAFGGRGGFD
jgi:hypothetical protein